MKYGEKLLSVIIPVYNVEPYLEKCLNSVISQTYRNLDIIIVNDGSTDRSGEISEYYQSIDKRVRVFHKKNGGASSARNLGLQYARGEFIGFVDGDDFIDEDMYESMLHEMSSDVDIVICGRRICFPTDMHQKSQIAFCTPKLTKMDHITAVEKFLQKKSISFSVGDKVCRRELFTGVSFPYNRTCEDIPVSYKLLKKSRNIIHLGKPKYNNFYRYGSTTRRGFFYKQIDYALFPGQICKDIARKYPDLLMQAEALYITCVLTTIGKIQSDQCRRDYEDMEKRLIKVLCHMYIRIWRNPFILPKTKQKIFKCILGETV